MIDKCRPNPLDPNGQCLTCAGYNRESGKTIHRGICSRKKLIDVMLYRKRGLGLTKRWPGTAVVNVTQRPMPKDVRVIEVSLGLCQEPLRLRVVKFTPQKGDETTRIWRCAEWPTEVFRRKQLATYCLDDVDSAAQDFEDYIVKHAITSMATQRTAPVKLRGPEYMEKSVIEQTYEMLIEHYCSLEV